MATLQQRSSVDCGIYVLLFTDTLIDRIVNSNIFNTEGELNGKLPNFEGYEILMQLVMLLHRRQYTSYDINTLKKFLNFKKYKIKQNTLTKANKTVPSVVSSCECETNNNKMKPNNKLKVAYFFRRNYFAEKTQVLVPIHNRFQVLEECETNSDRCNDSTTYTRRGENEVKSGMENRFNKLKKCCLSPTQIYVTVRLSKLISSQIPKAEEFQKLWRILPRVK